MLLATSLLDMHAVALVLTHVNMLVISALVYIKLVYFQDSCGTKLLACYNVASNYR